MSIRALAQFIVWLMVAIGLSFLLVRYAELRLYALHYQSNIEQASISYHVPRNLIISIMREESHFDPQASSRVGAVGLMQILPNTAQWIATKRGITYKSDSLSDPAINIDYGSWYLSYLRQQFKNDDTLTIEAYNAGITNVAAWEKEHPGYVAFSETSQFVDRVKRSWAQYDRIYGSVWENLDDQQQDTTEI
jgi:soluble lytic murein transglycosylase